MTTTLTTRVIAWLRAQEWVVEETDLPGRFVLHPSDGTDPWPVLVFVDDDEARVLVYSVLPDDVPAERRAAVAELAARVNYGLLNGALEIDLADGEVRARTSLHLGSATPDDPTLAALLAQTVGANLVLMDAAWDPLHDVMAGRLEPAEAAAALE